MTTDGARPLPSAGLGRPAEPPVGWVLARALKRAARMMRRKSPRTDGSKGRVRDLRRVLLVAPPLGPGVVTATDASPPLDLVDAADSLRAAGFQVEVYDARMAADGARSIGLHIEHSYPHVVVAVARGTTSGAACRVLGDAKEVIPGIVTVLVGAQPATTANLALKSAAADYAISDIGSETLSGLLARLSGGGPRGRIAESQAA